MTIRTGGWGGAESIRLRPKSERHAVNKKKRERQCATLFRAGLRAWLSSSLVSVPTGTLLLTNHCWLALSRVRLWHGEMATYGAIPADGE